jgi:small ligand-binding sensory domain FIST
MVATSNNHSMQWVSALSTRPSLEAAVSEVVQRAQVALNYAPVNLGVVFISAAFASEYPRLMPLLEEKLPGVPLIGCSGGGIVGMQTNGEAREIEGEVALSLTLASLPGVHVRPFYIGAEDLPDLDAAPQEWVDLVGVDPADGPQFIVLADPFTPRLNDLLQGLDFAYAGATKVGGMASTGSGSNRTGLFCNYRLYREGTVGVALSGAIVLETIVAQGCRPIGQPFLVKEAERNVLLALELQTIDDAGELSSRSEHRPPLQVLQELVQDLSENDRNLAQTALFVGIAQSEFKLKLEQGDFLIRQLIGVDPKTGALAIGDRIRPGQRIQFHLRDADAAALDLETLLKRYQSQSLDRASPSGALLFACLGRGESLYDEADFDSRLFRRYVPVPLTGFFCNGEIGPVGSSTFLHGFTAVFGIFRQP